MNLFYAPDLSGDFCTLGVEESNHCVRVLRLGVGDGVELVDGCGTLCRGVIERADAKACGVRITERRTEYGKRPYRLHIAIAPTKNIDRMAWMLEKCTEMGVDEVTMLRAAHSERTEVKMERMEKVVVAAMKQSQKAYLPQLNPMTTFSGFMRDRREQYRFIAHCREGEKVRLDEVYRGGGEVVALIGPEGDFSEEEVRLALAGGFRAITLGQSRLRTETAGIVVCHSIQFINRW